MKIAEALVHKNPNNTLYNFLSSFNLLSSFENWPLNFGLQMCRRVARNFRGQGRFLQIRAQIFGSSECQS